MRCTHNWRRTGATARCTTAPRAPRHSQVLQAVARQNLGINRCRINSCTDSGLHRGWALSPRALEVGAGRERADTLLAPVLQQGDLAPKNVLLARTPQEGAHRRRRGQGAHALQQRGLCLAGQRGDRGFLVTVGGDARQRRQPEGRRGQGRRGAGHRCLPVRKPGCSKSGVAGRQAGRYRRSTEALAAGGGGSGNGHGGSCRPNQRRGLWPEGS